MGEEGEKTCPLCAEEMDLTDQQLKPCKCGYEICVWCWHHIMEMAEKDDSEGRCPACRTPYNKEKIVGAAANCERPVAGVNAEKKVRPNKGKSKAPEGRKQLSSVRVIQRNLVYIVGLPLNLADEDLLQHKDYFGQYGKVLKVSVSRTTTGAIQHFTNNTCSVYITYSKEEEAFLCIQSVHGIVLEGKTLRACYGTTKYCHAWLRNVPCSNTDCLYLHEFGSQEDSFSKDDLVTAYTRNKVQQVTGATNSTQKRFGNALPAPADDYCIRTSANNLPGSLKISPPSSSCGRSVALPAGSSWGTGASNNTPTSGSLSSSNGPHKQKSESINGSVTFSAMLASSNSVLLPKKENNIKEKPLVREESKLTDEPAKERIDTDCQIDASDKPVTPYCHNKESISSKQCCLPAIENGDKYASSPSNINNSDPLLSKSWGSTLVDDQKDILNEKINKTCSDVASTSLGRHLVLEEGYVEQHKASTTSSTAGKSESSQYEISASVIKPGGGLFLESARAEAAFSEGKDELLSSDSQRPKDPGFISSADIFNSSHQKKVRSYPGQHNGRSTEDMQSVLKSPDPISQSFCASGLMGASGLLNGYPENNLSSSGSLSTDVEHSSRYPRDEKTSNMWRSDSEGVGNGYSGGSDLGEDNIISNILSLDIDSWDESLTSPQNLAKVLGDTDKQHGSLKVSTSWKVQQSNQSRFSFAREESMGLGSGAESATIEQTLGPRSFDHGIYLNKFKTRNGSLVNGGESDFYSSSRSDFRFNKLPVSRPHVSAPPGFSAPNRAPPPGFASHERIEQQSLNSPSGDYQIGASSMLRNHYLVPPAGNVANDVDVELIDPAILAVVGEGRFPNGLNSPGLDTRPNFSPQFRSFENEANFQLFAQRSSHQNHRFVTGDTYSSFGESFRFPSNVVEQSIVNNTAQYSQVVHPPQSSSPWVSNGHWDTWKDVQGGNNPGIAELHHERLGFNKFYTGFEDSKLHMPNQGNVYKPFGI